MCQAIRQYRPRAASFQLRLWLLIESGDRLMMNDKDSVMIYNTGSREAEGGWADGDAGFLRLFRLFLRVSTIDVNASVRAHKTLMRENVCQKPEETFQPIDISWRTKNWNVTEI